MGVSTNTKRVILVIENDGKPLPKGLRLFEKGQSRRKGGSGQGLALCKEIIQAHGGTIQGASKTSRKGAQFVVELPLHD